MSLGSWFRDYVYIPLGGNKKNFIRNLFVVWFLTGLWHGASYNFILWGLYFGFLLYLEKLLLKKYISKIPLFIRHISTVFLVVISFYIFAFDNTFELIEYGKILFFLSGNDFYDINFLFYLYSNIVLLFAGFLFCTPVKKIFDERLKDGYIKGIIYFVLFVLVLASLVSSNYNPFLYFRF